MRPVAAWAGAGKVAEIGRGFLLGEVFCRERMTGLARIDVQADSTLVERLDDVAAVRIENIKETPFIDHTAAGIHFNNHVADRADALLIETAEVSRCDAKQIVTVGHRIERMREVAVARRQPTIESLAAHDVVLHISRTVAPRNSAVVVLLEAHHDALGVDRFGIPNRRSVEVPANGARRVNNGNLRNEAPRESAAFRIVPDCARISAVGIAEVVDKVETIFEFRIDLLHLYVKHQVLFAGSPRFDAAQRTAIDRIGVFTLDLFAVKAVRILDFNLVGIVGIKTEHRNAGMRKQLRLRNIVCDFLAAVLRHHTDMSREQFVAAVLNDGGERRNLIRVDDHFAEITLLGKTDDSETARRSHGKGSACGGDGKRRTGQKKGALSKLHDVFLFCIVSRGMMLSPAVLRKYCA